MHRSSTRPRSSRATPLTFLIVLFVSAALYAQHEHARAHAATQPAPGQLPAERGQAAFAAIQEIVSMLEADPDTNWSRVDLGALRRHLVDMDQLLTAAVVETEPLPRGARFRVRGDQRTIAAAGRMLPAHAAMLGASTTGWSTETTVHDDSVELVVVVLADVPEETASHEISKIRGLGLFGILALGGHHPVHHLMLATGASPH